MGVLIGILIALGIIAGLAALNLHFFGWPDFNRLSPQAWSHAIATAPLHAKTLISGSNAVAALAGGLVAVIIARWRAAGWIVPLTIALIGAATALLIPQPLWMQIAAVVAPLFAGLVVSGASEGV